MRIEKLEWKERVDKGIQVTSTIARSPQRRTYYQYLWGQLSTTCSNVTVQPHEQRLVAADGSQLRTMLSETADPIDFLLPSLFT